MCTPKQETIPSDDESEQSSNSSAEEASENSSSDSDDAEDALCNPEADDPAIEAHIDILREQSIGNTVYSKRFVLTQLMKLVRRQYELDEEYEKDLTRLWDMTGEKEVVIFMAENDAFAVFREVVEFANNLRLIEISVGIVANMCTVKEIFQKYRDELPIYLHMLSCIDAPTLIQLMRLLYVISVTDDHANSWLEIISKTPDFVNNLSHILSNSTNKVLLANSLITVNTLLDRLSKHEQIKETENGPTVADIFVNTPFVQSIFDAYECLDINFNISDDCAEPPDAEYSIHNVMAGFFAIHCTLMQFKIKSREVYREMMPILLREMNSILKEFQNTLSLTILPFSFVEDLLVSACSIHVFNIQFGYHCDREGFKSLLEIWAFIRFNILNAGIEQSENEDDDELKVCFEGLDEWLADGIGKMLDQCEEIELPPLLLAQDKKIVAKLLQYYKEGEVENDRLRSEFITNLLENQEGEKKTQESVA